MNGKMVWLNGQLVPSEEAVVSVWDRSFLYGDGLFETLRAYGGRVFRWTDHWRRLSEGAALLKISIPYSPRELLEAIQQVLSAQQLSDGITRIHLSRGIGPRGYSIQGASTPFVVIGAFPLTGLAAPNTAALILRTSAVALPPRDPIGFAKSANKLAVILAQTEAEETGAHAGILLDPAGNVAETSIGNLFWIEESGMICGPPLTTGALAGVTRKVVLEICEALGLEFRERLVMPPQLRDASGIFVTSTGLEIKAVATLDDVPIRAHPIIDDLGRTYRTWATEPTPERKPAD